MDLLLILKGIVIGFSIAAPVGPIGILCIRRTLSHGKVIGFVSGLGAATADAMYGLIAGLGLTIITNLLLNYASFIQIIGAVFLTYLGIKIFTATPGVDSAKADGTTVFTAYFSTLFLTITNPMTIMSFLGIFSGLGILHSISYLNTFILVLGVFIGSAIWWLILSSFANLFKKKMGDNSLSIINKLSGAILIAFAFIVIMEMIMN